MQANQDAFEHMANESAQFDALAKPSVGAFSIKIRDRCLHHLAERHIQCLNVEEVMEAQNARLKTKRREFKSCDDIIVNDIVTLCFCLFVFSVAVWLRLFRKTFW